MNQINQQQTLQQQGQLQPQYIRINDIKPYLKNLNIVFIVVDKGPPIKKNEGGTLFQVLVADSTASINMTLFDAIGEQSQPGDILRLRGGYSTIYKNMLNLYAGKTGTVEKIGEFTLAFTETPNLSAVHYSVDPNNPKQFVASSHKPGAGVMNTPPISGSSGTIPLPMNNMPLNQSGIQPPMISGNLPFKTNALPGQMKSHPQQMPQQQQQQKM